MSPTVAKTFSQTQAFCRGISVDSRCANIFKCIYKSATSKKLAPETGYPTTVHGKMLRTAADCLAVAYLIQDNETLQINPP